MFRLKTGKAASRPRFPMGVPHIVFSAKLGDIYAGNTAGIVSARWDIRTRAPVAASFRFTHKHTQPMEKQGHFP